jgi:hypothetical protein
MLRGELDVCAQLADETSPTRSASHALYQPNGLTKGASGHGRYDQVLCETLAASTNRNLTRLALAQNWTLPAAHFTRKNRARTRFATKRAFR